MPIYTYRCKNCNYQFEKRQRMSEEPLTDCPECANGRVRRVVNSVGVVFKGSGFYVTDNRKNKANGKSNGKVNGSANGKAEPSTKKDTSAESESKAKSSAPAKAAPSAAAPAA